MRTVRSGFYRFPLRLARLSGQCDEVTVLLHEDQAAGGAVVPGARLDICGAAALLQQPQRRRAGGWC